MNNQRFRRLLAVVLVLLTFTGLYLIYINRTIQQDEAYTLRHYAVSPAHALLAYTAPNNHLLHSFFLWLSTSLIGQSLIGVRLPAFAFGLLALAMAYRVGLRLHGYRAGLLALALVGSSYAFADFAVSARGYTMSVFFTLSLMDLTLFASEQMTRRESYAVMFTCAALMMVLPSMIIYIAGIIVWLLVMGGSHDRTARRWLVPPMMVGTGIGGLFYAAAYARGFLTEYLQTFGATDGNATLGGLLSEWVGMMFRSPLADVMFVVGLVGGVVVLARRRSLASWYVAQLAVMVALAVMQYVVMHRLFFARNYLYLVGPLAVLAAIGLARFPLSAYLPLVLVGLSIVPFSSLGAETNIDQFLSRVEQNIGEGDTLVMGCCLAEPAWYHLQREGRAAMLVVTAATRRVFIAEGQGDKLDTLLDTYALRDLVDGCAPVDNDSWSPFSVYTCPMKRDVG
jgi:hypothetical protein